MSMNSLALASDLSDQDLLARIASLASREREASVELVAHLAVLDTRPALYAARSYGSLFGYCTKVLRLSEDAACNRIEAARACRSVPVILDHLASGAMSLTSVRLLRRHLTPENHGKESHDKLRRLQALLRREIPDGDPAAIFDRALTLLLAKVERTKLGAAAKPRPPRPIRPGTDKEGWRRVPASRYVPGDVKRGVWRRDEGQCGFVAHDGQRCTERTFLEFHHIQPYAQGGPATVENISLRCRRHNQYEADLVFGPHRASVKGPWPDRSSSDNRAASTDAGTTPHVI